MLWGPLRGSFVAPPSGLLSSTFYESTMNFYFTPDFNPLKGQKQQESKINFKKFSKKVSRFKKSITFAPIFARVRVYMRATAGRKIDIEKTET